MDDTSKETFPDISEKIAAEAERKAGEQLFRLKYGSPKMYIRLRWYGGMPYTYTRELIKKSDLPELYSMLDDQAYAEAWPDVATMIGYVGDDPAAAEHLLKYATRKDDWSKLPPPEKFKGMASKIGNLMWIGRLGGRDYVDELKKAVTPSGAEELTKEWIDGPLPEWVEKDRTRVVQMIQGAAAKGLVIAQDPDGIEIVKQMYLKEHSLCSSSNSVTELYNQLVDAVSLTDFITDQGLDKVLSMIGQQEYHGKLRPYIIRYAYHLKNRNGKSGD